MGANLIGYMLKGPAKVSAAKRDAAIGTAAKRVKDVLAHEHEFEDMDPSEILDRYPWLDALDNEYGDMDAIFEYLKGIGIMDIRKATEEFIEAFVECEARDIARRPDPDDKTQTMVFAGDMSWGDEPEGFGYQSIKNAQRFGIDELLGYR